MVEDLEHVLDYDSLPRLDALKVNKIACRDSFVRSTKESTTQMPRHAKSCHPRGRDAALDIGYVG